MAYVKNWREVQPDISHMSAVHWGGLRPGDGGDSDDDRNRLTRLGGFARHALQGRKTSDHHKHERLEQVYYILSGSGEVLFDGSRFPVESGDAVYLPSGLYHQMFNDMNEGWLEHHVVSMPVEADGGDIAIRNWRRANPQGDGGGAIRWHQLGPLGEGDSGCLRGMAFIDREAVQPQSRSATRRYEDLEQVYYGLENSGVFTVEGKEVAFTEGDMVHLPPGCEYSIANPNRDWVSYLIMAA